MMNPTTCIGESLTLLPTSSSYLISPPKTPGMLTLSSLAIYDNKEKPIKSYASA